MFESLSTKVECYKYNNFGHMAKDCRMTVSPREPQQNNNNHRHEPQKRTWIRNQNQYSNEDVKKLNRSTNIITTNTEYTIDPQSKIEETTLY